MSHDTKDSNGSASPPSAEGPPGAPESGDEFRLTRGWVALGVVAVLIGLGIGLLMSASWLR